MSLLDTTFNQSPEPVPDDSLPGGRRATLRYVWWSVYVKATGNVEMRTSLTCTHLCENPGNHKHGPPCKIGGCAAECPYNDHQTTLEATSSSRSSSTISQALTRARESVRSVTASVGASAFGVTAGLSGTASESSSSSVTLGSSISSAVGRSVSGSVSISLGHFNKKPCTSETWYFGTKEYEVRMILQVFEQDYYAESWVFGGTHGVLPGSGLKLAGEARFVGTPQDVQLGTYQVPSNEPIDKKSDLDCGCKPKPVITPSPGDREHSSLPSGTSKFYVTPEEDEKIFFTNPLDETVLVTYAGIVVEIEPGDEKEIDRGDLIGAIPIDVTTVEGERVMRVVYGAGLDDGKSQAETWEESFATYEADIASKSKSKGKVETTWKVGKGEKSLPLPEVADEIVAPQDPPLITLIEMLIAAGPATTALPVMNGKTPVIEIRGDIPDGATFHIESGDSQTAGDVFLKIKGIDGETRAVFVKFDGVRFEKSSARLVMRNCDGVPVSDQDISLQQAAIHTSMTPTSGPAGSSATLIIDTREVMAFMAQNSGAHTNQFDILLDFSSGGGATGPERIAMDPSGITRVPVRRGSVPGGFQVAIRLAYRQNGGHELGHILGDAGGLQARDQVKSDPGKGILKGG